MQMFCVNSTGYVNIIHYAVQNLVYAINMKEKKIRAEMIVIAIVIDK